MVAHSEGRLRENFMYHHFRSKVAMVQEVEDPLPRCDLCVIHITAGRIIRHRRTARCNKNNQMRWRRRDVAIADRYSEVTFSLIGEEEVKRIEGVEVIKCLGRLLERSDDDCPAVLHNIWKARQVWGRIGKFLRREGADPKFLANFYHAVVQAVLLFGADTWVLSAPMVQRLEVAYVGFLRKVIGKKAKRLRDGLWQQAASKTVLQGGRDTAALDICGQETGNSGGVGGPMANFRCLYQRDGLLVRGETPGAVVEAGGSREEAEGHGRSNFSVTRVRRLQESGRHGRIEGGPEGGAQTAKGRGEAGIIGMLGRRQVTSSWEDDPVRRHDRRQWRGCQGRRDLTPRKYIGRREGREGQDKNKYLTISDRA